MNHFMINFTPLNIKKIVLTIQMGLLNLNLTKTKISYNF
jgi:hypothetical protein